MSDRWRGGAVRTAVAAAALVFGLIANAAGGSRALDALTPTGVAVDRRVVVVVFAEDSLTSEVAHLWATYYRDIATIVTGAGATSVGFVDFDSLAFSDGGAGRSNVIGSAVLQRYAVGPLHDIALRPAAGELPLLVGYRVDSLATEVAGIGLPLDDTRGTRRLVPALARASVLGDGAIVRWPEFALAAAERDSTYVVPGFALRLMALAEGTAFAAPNAGSVTIGEDIVPLEQGQLRVRWSSGLDDLEDAAVVTFDELRFGELAPGVFDGAIVLVGNVDPASSQYVETPVGRLPEVLVHANALNTVLTQNYSERAPTWPSVLTASLAAVALVTLPTRRRWILPLAAAAVAIGWLLIVRSAAGGGTLVDPLTVPVTAVSAALMIGGVGQLRALRERRQLRTLFSQYVAPSVAEILVRSGRGGLARDGERVAITAVFCDMRGFTSMVGRLEPGQVRALLNTYYEELGRAVVDEGGTVLQYTGDEIFAVFGAPLPMSDHARAGLDCAHRMFAALPKLNRLLLHRGLPPVNFGIGVHSGDVVAAHVGSSIRMQYSVIGDTVNVANRHCNLARAGQIVVSEVTALLTPVPDGATRLDDIEMKGLGGKRHAFAIQVGPDAVCGSQELAAADADSIWRPAITTTSATGDPS